ncbi:GAF and ANTAR domain-containing protein [Amycolatopsis endophytica]|uniref:ANTAR domain-containing protein n=1 Tax=Amycolatopsis endophytica TaxID=860233 RepID=A0A853B3U1_9PSEU|nr:ANTAR domain-containing protein [Amycolatopsis endophytica]NYI89502.1 hypothetical protein [Amycolatopsis endophytica]
MRTELIDTLLDLMAPEAGDFDAHQYARRLAEHAVARVPARDAGVLLADTAGPVIAGTGSAAALVKFQFDHDEGPVPGYLHSGSSTGDSWPRFSAACAEAGYSSVHAVPIGASGVLCLFDPVGNFADTGTRLASVAALRLAHQRDLHQLDVRLRHLQAALDSRIVIEQAKGMLAERHKIGVDTAFEGLRRYARDHNQRVADLARAVVEGRDPVRAKDF